MQNLKLKVKNYNGFSIMELAVVLAIFIILTAIGIVEFAKFDQKAIREGSLASSKALAQALKMYRSDNGFYPQSTDVVWLGAYTDVTRLMKSFDTTVTDPINGVQIWTDNTKNPQPYCIYAAVKGVNKPGANYGAPGSYDTKICVETNETDASTKSTDQPTCYWGGKHDWQACAKGL